MCCRPALLPLLAIQSACASPSPPMWQAQATRIDVAGNSFLVHHDGHRAEAVRTSPAPAPRTRAMLVHAKAAMERASGCAVRRGTLYGDAVLSEAFLDCAGAPGVRLQAPQVFTPP